MNKSLDAPLRAYPSIIDNQPENTLLAGLKRLSGGGRELWVATAFFSLNSLFLLADELASFDRIRILFGDDADAAQRRKLLALLRETSDRELLAERETHPRLTALTTIERLFQEGRVEARCYTAKKFHAKAYLIHRPTIYPHLLGVIGSGNFTQPGLMKNIELNVELSADQLTQLHAWYEERWAESVHDVVTDDVLDEVRRQITLYDPYVIYSKALNAWAEAQQADQAILTQTKLAEKLDEHQRQGFLQALKIIEREHGVMICDGVGLGKSFIAMALIERYCRLGKNVLLIAPKNIMQSSWLEYLEKYLSTFRAPYGNIYEIPMTELGFDPEDPLSEKKREHVRRLAERSDVIVIDESHNFRSTSAARYGNLFQIIAPHGGERKKTILLTATPINTAYKDLSAQLALITHEKNSIGGYRIEQIRRFAATLDKDDGPPPMLDQLRLRIEETPNESLNSVLESVVIQRSRKTCQELSKAAGKTLRFPRRTAPQCVEYELGAGGYKALVTLARLRFQPGVDFLDRMRKEIEAAEKQNRKLHPAKVAAKLMQGIKLAAFLTEQYRRDPIEGRKTYQEEVLLAELVFSNTLKQLESSPAAFQGILQSLGEGLIARLRVVLNDEATPIIAPHLSWVRAPLFTRNIEADADAPEDEVQEDEGKPNDILSEETEAFLNQAISERQLVKKLLGFTQETFDIPRWRDDIASDLRFLQEIHAATLAARKEPDPKLAAFVPLLKRELDAGCRVLVFTQSQRTAQYLEMELRSRLPGREIARIDSRVDGDYRAALLHAFSPGYNPLPSKQRARAPLDILISTDVLSEGVNLQEAGAICNYDIHWNPVRLIQRIGRVDRRLDPDITPDDPSFSIYNVLPPDEINDIIELIGAVEKRAIRISNTLGLDASFFKSDDPAGNLRELNAWSDGEMSDTDKAFTEYAAQIARPDPALQNLLAQLPPGAFGVWGNAPENGLFALFLVTAGPKATDADQDRFSALIGRPVLALTTGGAAPTFDAGAILALLSKTTPGEHSATPSDEAELAVRLKALKSAARQQFAQVQLPATITLRLVCWMELKT